MADQENNAQTLILLGEIKGLVQGLKDGQDMQAKRLDGMDAKLSGMDTRLRNVEQRSAVIGAASGGLMAVGMAVITEGIRAWMRSGGH